MLLSFLNDTSISLQTILWPIFIGISIAALICLYNKHITGRFVMKLIDENANDESSAKSLKELGFEKNYAVRFALKSGSLYNKIIKHPESQNTKFSIDNTVYYIPDEQIDRAKLLYSRNGAPILLVILAMLLFLLAVALLFYIVPGLISMFHKIAG